MDNDLMARRLQPPSEPAQNAPLPGPFILPEYVEQETPSFQEWPLDPAPAETASQPLTEDPAAETPPAYATPPWSTQARAEVPWDRPSDYDHPTDTASPDQPSWDRPAPELWTDSDLGDDPAAAVFGSVADGNDDGLSYWPDTTGGRAAAVASTPRIEEAPAMAAAVSDLDDAHAPLLGDFAMPATRAWPEMNGHDAGRNDATLVESIAHTVEPALTVAPDQMVRAASQPLILRIELAIVDDSRLVVGAADAAWRVNDVNAVVLEVGQSDVPPTAEAATPRHPAFETRGNNGGQQADPTDVNAAPASVPAESTWLEPAAFPGMSADEAFPAATHVPPPWLEPTTLAGPEPAPWEHPADPVAPAPPDSFGMASVPPASTLPPPWAQPPLPARTTDWPPDDFAPSGRQADVDQFASVRDAPRASASGAPRFAAPGLVSPADQTAPRLGMAQSAFAPPVYVEREPAPAQEHSDLWFLATEPADGDAATADEATVGRGPSRVLTAVLTIAFAILVIVLVLVFIQLMTSLLR